MIIPGKRIPRSCLPCCQTEDRQEQMVKRKSGASKPLLSHYVFSLEEKNIPCPQKLAINGKREKHTMKHRNCRLCPLRASFLGMRSIQLLRTTFKRFSVHNFMLCRCHLGILNKFSTGGPRFLLFTGPKKLGSHPCPSLCRVSSAQLVHNSDFPHPLLLSLKWAPLPGPASFIQTHP